MNECQHVETEMNCYTEQFYFNMYIIKVVTCKECKEIIEESKKKLNNGKENETSK